MDLTVFYRSAKVGFCREVTVLLPHSDSHLPTRILVAHLQSGHKTAEPAQKSGVQELKTGQRRKNYII